MELLDDPYIDGRHLHPRHIDFLIDLFTTHYTRYGRSGDA